MLKHVLDPCKQLGTGIGILPVQLREVHYEIQGKPILTKLYLAPFPNCFSDTEDFLQPHINILPPDTSVLLLKLRA